MYEICEYLRIYRMAAFTVRKLYSVFYCATILGLALPFGPKFYFFLPLIWHPPLKYWLYFVWLFVTCSQQTHDVNRITWKQHLEVLMACMCVPRIRGLEGHSCTRKDILRCCPQSTPFVSNCFGWSLYIRALMRDSERGRSVAAIASENSVSKNRENGRKLYSELYRWWILYTVSSQEHVISHRCWRRNSAWPPKMNVYPSEIYSYEMWNSNKWLLSLGPQVCEIQATIEYALDQKMAAEDMSSVWQLYNGCSNHIIW